MVTAELAMAIPSIVVLLAILVWVAVLVTAQIQVVDAARAGARAGARGESVAAVAAVAEEMAPPGANAIISGSDGDLRVEVEVLVQPLGGIPVLPAVRVEAVAFAAVEDTVGSERGAGLVGPAP